MDKRDPEFLRDSLRDMDSGWTMTIELLTATAVWGAIGWFLDRWLDTEPWLLAGGIILGFGLGSYLVILRAKEQGEAEDAKRARL